MAPTDSRSQRRGNVVSDNVLMKTNYCSLTSTSNEHRSSKTNRIENIISHKQDDFQDNG